VDVFNELEHTDAFDTTLGALASKQRAYLQREWDRKNALAAEAKRAELEAMRKKNNVRQHLGILAASSAGAFFDGRKLVVFVCCRVLSVVLRCSFRMQESFLPTGVPSGMLLDQRRETRSVAGVD
jgi:hypothetical protein